MQISDRDLILNFESLGGAGHGCEFGLVQRALGVEPLGLLRWADLDHRLLTQALETEFAGVGLSENTNVFVPPDHIEWWTCDKRFWMAMRTFVSAATISYEEMVDVACRRLRFLREKLIRDLREGEKIFVFRNMLRDLTAAEIHRLHAAVRAYGKATLFYVQYSNDVRQSGEVRSPEEGLLWGYMDRFAFSRDDKPLGPATESWLAVCRRAFEMWPRKSLNS